jgi:alanine-glyoxylate transaminase/(R)-3-amino-2-methylpropionate-pyruvate transaminase
LTFNRGYLKKAFARTRELGGVCISDEVQTGFGRTGEHFWGFQVKQFHELILVIGNK